MDLVKETRGEMMRERDAELAAAQACVKEVNRPPAEKFAITFTAQEVQDLSWILLAGKTDTEYECPKCGTHVPEDNETHLYCATCGRRLVQEEDFLADLDRVHGITEQRWYRIWDKAQAAAEKARGLG